MGTVIILFLRVKTLVNFNDNSYIFRKGSLRTRTDRVSNDGRITSSIIILKTNSDLYFTKTLYKTFILIIYEITKKVLLEVISKQTNWSCHIICYFSFVLVG